MTFFTVRDAGFPIKFISDCDFFNYCSNTFFFSEKRQCFKNPQIILVTL